MEEIKATVTETTSFTIRIGETKFENLKKGQTWNGFVEYKGGPMMNGITIIVDTKDTSLESLLTGILGIGEIREFEGQIVKASPNVLKAIRQSQEDADEKKRETFAEKGKEKQDGEPATEKSAGGEGSDCSQISDQIKE